MSRGPVKEVLSRVCKLCKGNRDITKDEIERTIMDSGTPMIAFSSEIANSLLTYTQTTGDFKHQHALNVIAKEVFGFTGGWPAFCQANNIK